MKEALSDSNVMPMSRQADAVLVSCIFCLATESLTSRQYGVAELPEGVTWPSSHCFQGKTLAVCSHCGGAFVHERMKDEDISAFYSAIYDARHVGRAPKMTDLNELNARFFSQSLYLKTFIHLKDGMRVLELGPNVVSSLPALSLFCRPEYHYFDQVDSTIIARYGGRRLGSYASGAEIVRKLGEDSLDLVYASHSLEHVNPSSLDELVKGVSSAIVPGGHFFFEVPDDLSINIVLVPHTLFFTEVSLRMLLERHGFEIVHLGRWGSPAGASPAHAARPDCMVDIGVSRRGSLIKDLLRRMLHAMPFLEKSVRPLRLQRALMLTLRTLPTPYESTPFFRVIARKR